MAEARIFTASWRLAVAWLPLFLVPAGVLAFVPADWPRWAQMWLLAFSIYGGCKWLTLATTPATSRWRQIAYLFAWPGLDAPTFLNPSIAAKRPGACEWILGTVNVALGIALFAGVARWMPPQFEVFRGWIAMAGTVFILHFGLFELLSCIWRRAGVAAAPLMNFPVLATSVSDFWSRRWNAAFRDFTHRFLFRPLARRLGPRWSIVVGFLFSGLVHDLVISVPAGGGYGMPTAFFLIQAATLLFERSSVGRHLGLMRGWHGWLFTMCVLLAPAPLLFHPPFARNVLAPFLDAVAGMLCLSTAQGAI